MRQCAGVMTSEAPPPLPPVAVWRARAVAVGSFLKANWPYTLAGASVLLLALFLTLRARPAVDIVRPTRGPAVEAVYATGTVEPVNWAKIGPKVTSRIVSILAKEGESVMRGQVLARLDDREARANVANFAAREQFQRDEKKRFKELFDKRLVSRQQYERAMSDHEQALEALNGARQALADLTLVAPLDGTVLRQDGQVGEVVTSTSVLYWVGESGKLWITADVDEEDIPRVRAGQRVLIKSDAFPDQALQGQVAEITPKGDPVQKTYRVRVGLPLDTPLKIGMTTEINVVVREEPNALLIPATALVDGHVWAVRGGRARKVKVQVGVIGTQQAQVLSGIADDDVVIVYPSATLKEGKSVRELAAP